ncbi:hypothetical protein GN956_G15853 [Arapaima gigas]
MQCAGFKHQNGMKGCDSKTRMTFTTDWGMEISPVRHEARSESFGINRSTLATHPPYTAGLVKKKDKILAKSLRSDWDSDDHHSDSLHSFSSRKQQSLLFECLKPHFFESTRSKQLRMNMDVDRSEGTLKESRS